METEPVESMEASWMKYGQMMLLVDLLATLRGDWNAAGIKLWAERKLEELQNDN